MSAFDRSLPYVLANEGIDSDHPADTGGRTRFGITEAVARFHGLDVRRLTLAQAKTIYRKDYWRFDGLHSIRVAAKCLDIAVNLGVAAGIRLIQRTAGVTADGLIGPITRAAINRANEEEFLDDLAMSLADFYISIALSRSSQLAFLRGWIRRAIRKPKKGSL